MSPAAAVIDLLRTLNDSNASEVIGQLSPVAASWVEPARETKATLQHLETLAFRLEGSGRFGDAARVYEIGAAAPGSDRVRWADAAAEARVRDLCGRRLFEEARCFLASLRGEGAGETRVRTLVPTLLALGWGRELASDAEGSVGCYRLALEFAAANGKTLTQDGRPLSGKIKDLRRLQLDDLVEEGAFADATALHETTRHLINAGPFATYDIVTARQLSDRSEGATYVELRPSRPIATPALKFLEPPGPLTSEPGELIAQPQYLAFIKGCRAFPRSNVVVADGALLYDLAAHPRRESVLIQDGLNPDQIMMAAFGATRALVETPPKIQTIEAGLMMFGLQSRNYGHWFCEFVPRMLCYNDPRCPGGIPLCVDDHMPATHEEIVALLDERDRPLIKLAPTAVEFGMLGVAPVPAFFPFEMKPGRRVYDTTWPADILVDLRARVLERARERGALDDRTDRRLFISRKAFSQRQLVNEGEIADLLRPLGFEVIYPETMSFLDQVRAFHAAEIVVGSSSSALTNGLFCRPGCQVLGLIHENLSFNFRGYTSFIEAGGAQLTFIRGRTVQEDGLHAFHASYTVSPAKVLAGLQQVLGSLMPPPRRQLSLGGWRVRAP